MAMLAYDFHRQHQLTGADKEALALVVGDVTARQVAQELGVSHTTTCNRLQRLVQRGHLQYKRRIIDGGGHEYVYRRDEGMLHMRVVQSGTSNQRCSWRRVAAPTRCAQWQEDQNQVDEGDVPIEETADPVKGADRH